ncbi:NADP-dependent oxidoreductase domain protein [Acididesulfobacillus acetoxydans]|uniref:NADP-dependent oxidoreductase domain protein n=1 Tax=Acididesulfobacillus acetoxydans TaxID=1561005 RepID=A0A8S0W258_9FIRM|nr:aldo/keto reductase [Acididesulfobacillus acetoxydans]CAA7600418.1 NADP-dependent oxidoreductase domain protein [Acididesulfobacillus acetoxydans]CEJ06552.1 Oxidoreductase, aldo/keto reductase [Acididesulfobacillus acetoxydans]
MLYRKFGHTDFHVSALGFGSMRLPVLEGDAGKVDETKAVEMIRYAIDHGVNYVDTAYLYHQGQSEILVAKALRDGYREKVKLATKLPVWLTEHYEDFDRYLNEQLEKLGTDHIDFYLLHALNRNTWPKAKEAGVLRFLDRAAADGRIGYAGFSFHDEEKLFEEIIDAYSWTFCQMQYNYMDTNIQAGTEGLNYAAAKGLAVIIMEPIKGGKLAANPPRAVQELWASAPTERTPAEWALRWVWNHPQVSLVLSGMSTMEQVQENVRIAAEAEPNSLTSEELRLIGEVRKTYAALTKVGCTGCGYCLPCPSGVDIPRNFALYNDAYIYDQLDASVMAYQNLLEEGARASACVECGECESVCPQQLNIRIYLKEVHRTLSRGN